jgi:hypothetical protein
MPPNTMKVDRATRWGNPYPVDAYGRELALALFRNTVEGCWSPGLVEHLDDPTVQTIYLLHTSFRAQHAFSDVRALRGKNLACWCKPGEPCHADVLLELANKD